MRKSTWKQFKDQVLTSKCQFLGATNNKTLEDIKEIIDTRLESIEPIYDRKGVVRSKHINFEYTDGSSRLDCTGKVWEYKGCYIIADWNHIIYRFKKDK